MVNGLDLDMQLVVDAVTRAEFLLIFAKTVFAVADTVGGISDFLLRRTLVIE